MTWRIELGPDQRHEEAIIEGLVEHNQKSSRAIRRRFEPDNLPARPVSAYAVDDAGELLGGCVGSTVDVWQWLTVDMMWVRPSHRGQGLGRLLLTGVEEQAREVVLWTTGGTDGPVDPLLAAYDPSAHVTEDLFRAKAAFVALLDHLKHWQPSDVLLMPEGTDAATLASRAMITGRQAYTSQLPGTP